MALTLDSARYEGGRLIFSTSDPSARRLVYNFKPGLYELVKARKKRSLDANAYCWALCTEIANAVGLTKEEVYRRAISEGGEYTQLVLRPDAVEAFRRVWQSRGVGWVVEIVDDTTGGNKLVFAYYGSSAYDSRQMSALIDRLVQDAKALEIETLSEREISLLKENWR